MLSWRTKTTFLKLTLKQLRKSSIVWSKKSRKGRFIKEKLERTLGSILQDFYNASLSVKFHWKKVRLKCSRISLNRILETHLNILPKQQ